MQGEYRGDFTRDTFYAANHFCRVLMQQGRVQLDADWNEQTAILLHFLRSLTRDLIGQHGGPNPPAGANVAGGFAISTESNDNGKLSDLTIAPGHYYVDGILCEAEPPASTGNADAAILASVTYLTQPDFPALKPPDVSDSPTLPNIDGNALVYLDVWERHLTSVQQDGLREVALGGPDTASRARIVWQVKIQTTLPVGLNDWPTQKLTDSQWQNWINLWQPTNRGFLKAQVQQQSASTDPCVISTQSAYRGTENQLYRVEIHTGTDKAGDNVRTGATDSNGKPQPPNGAVTFKWSRENGSVVFPILKLATTASSATVSLANLGRDSRLSLNVNDWVEIVDDVSDLSASDQLSIPGPLLQVQSVDLVNMVVTLAGATAITVDQPPTKHPLLRRWDQQQGDRKTNNLNVGTDGGALLAEGVWLTLEDGIQIQFQSAPSGQVNQYRSGDYWLIPARVATGDVEWPKLRDAQGQPQPMALPPHGVEHHYAPLAVIDVDGQGNVSSPPTDLRRTFGPLAA
jgi:hypothetical protein